jgi:hypothetical protein
MTIILDPQQRAAALATTQLFRDGSGLEVPGLETIIRIGQVGPQDSNSQFIPSKAPLINDRSKLERIRLSEIAGVQDDPDVRDARSPNPATIGERAGALNWSGRTIGLTGRVEGGNIPAIRDLMRRFKRSLTENEIDILLHTPFEVPTYVNVISNPNALFNTTGWVENSSVSGATLTRMTSAPFLAHNTAFSSAGTTPGSGGPWFVGMKSSVSGRIPVSPGSKLSGRISYRWTTKPAGASGSLTLLFRFYDANGTWLGSSLDASSSTGGGAAQGVFGELSLQGVRVPHTASSMEFIVFHSLTGISQAWDLRLGAAILVRNETCPPYFDFMTPGFATQKIPGTGPSYGPLFNVSQINAPHEADQPAVSTHPGWENVSSSGATINQAPIPTRAWSPPRLMARWDEYGASYYDVEPASIYAKITNPDTITRDLGIGLRESILEERAIAHSGRTYRFTADVNLLQQPAGVNTVLALSFINSIGMTFLFEDGGWTELGTVFVSQPLMPGVSEGISVRGVAPPGTTHMRARLIAFNVHTAGAVLEGYIGSSELIDITDHDPSDLVYGDLSATDTWYLDETDRIAGSMRRIPKPWLLRKVRVLGDFKAPEKQDDARYRRDFQVNLRAADPRLYVAAERSEFLTISGAPKYTIQVPPALDPTYAGTTPSGKAPTGYTLDSFQDFQYTTSGSVVTKPLTISVPRGSAIDGAYSLFAANYNPNNTLAIYTVGRWSYYRSAEGTTYLKPRSVVGCSINAIVGATPYYNTTDTDVRNYVGSVLKRTATAKLECRFVDAISGSTNQRIQIWAFVSSTWTKLAENALDADPQSENTYLVSYLSTGNIVNCEVWEGNPQASDSTLLGTCQTTLTGTTATALGVSVAATTGIVHGYAAPGGVITSGLSAPRPQAASTVFYHEIRDNDQFLAQTSKMLPVLGGIKTPVRIQLMGDVVNPTIYLNDDTFFLEGGPFTDAQPLVIDYDGSITRGGFDFYSGLKPGSRLGQLRDGQINTIYLNALSWTPDRPHMNIRWRDAER